MGHKPIKITINLDTVINNKSSSLAQQKGLTSGPKFEDAGSDSSLLQGIDNNDRMLNEDEDESDSHTSIVTGTL